MEWALRPGVLLALLFLAGSAQAQPKSEMDPKARAYLERGLKLYEQGDYLGASREFQLGHVIDPRPEFLFAAGQAERKAGDCKKATEFYHQYLKTGPPPKDAVAVGQLLDECDKKLRAQAAAEAPPAPVPQILDEPTPRPAPPPAQTVVAEPPAVVRQAPAPEAEYARLHLAAMLLGDVVSTQGSGEIGAAVALAPQADLGAAAGFGDSVGARGLLTLHPSRDESSRWGWIAQLRFLYQPVKGGEGVGGGALVAAAYEAAHGRFLAGVAGDFFSGPDRYFPYAVLGVAGYELDLLSR